MRPPISSLKISRDSLSLYGSLEPMLRGIREHRPLDLNAEVWRQAHPGGTFEEWHAQAHQCLLDGLHYDPGPLDLQAASHGREEREHFWLEEVSFNTTPWIRVDGYFLLPKESERPVPGLVVFHAWGGPMLFGRKRIVNSGRDHSMLKQHRNKVYSGNYLAEEFAKAGYAVIVIDAHHFGDRAPRGIGEIPDEYDPFELSVDEYEALDGATRDELYYGMRQLNWAGTTWMGLNYWDDSRCVDYLQSRPEVDPERIGCTGLSGGGWRTDILAALDGRIKASASGCWMTTGDYQQIYNVRGAIGTFCMLPGVWDRMDIPDLSILAAPNATMVISTSEDQLFPVEGQQEAARQISDGFEWAGCPENFRNVDPSKPHCYDADLQREAIEWFNGHLK
ncbi:MAG: acetylxylan esterase [Planctomycetota bacterium]|jgi:dienelactone hydrolase|nr:acetylxylan esterase [Planctomycetota bacterium]MDP6502403.1 acetylxylan esterase [Planctomycetota bacterium]